MVAVRKGNHKHEHGLGSQLLLLLPNCQLPICFCDDKECQAVTAGGGYWYRGLKSLLNDKAPDANWELLIAVEQGGEIGDWVVVYRPWLVRGIEEEPVIPFLRVRQEGNRWRIQTPTHSVRVWRGRQSSIANRWRAIGGIRFSGDTTELLTAMPEDISRKAAVYLTVGKVLPAWQAAQRGG